MWHSENRQTKNNDRREILNYLNSKSMVNLADSEENKGGYMLHVSDNGRIWYVGYELSNDARIRNRLTAKAGHNKLLGGDKKSQYNNDSQVWVQVLTL